MQTLHWILSDLQFSQSGSDGTTLPDAVDDILETGLPLDSVWLLGDLVYGKETQRLQQAARVIPAQMARLGVPVYYMMGNHEMDPLRETGNPWFPLYEQALSNPQWHVAPGVDDFFFTEVFGETLVVFMGDHAARDGSWLTILGGISNPAYPHGPKAYEALREKIVAHDGPVVTASHYAYAGGPRAGRLLNALLPLPRNVMLHLHGHAHIGDLGWNKENPWQRKNPIEGAAIHQFNISALEEERSPGSHSAILSLGEHGPGRLRIRCSAEKRWSEDFTFPLPDEQEREPAALSDSAASG